MPASARSIRRTSRERPPSASGGTFTGKSERDAQNEALTPLEPLDRPGLLQRSRGLPGGIERELETEVLDHALSIGKAKS